MLNRFIATTLLVCTLATPFAAFANGNPTHLPNHPRVDQVNQRIANQHSRIAAGENSGKLNAAQVNQFHAEYAGLKTEEHAMRAADGGHLTRGDQASLNRQLNARSNQIYGEKNH